MPVSLTYHRYALPFREPLLTAHGRWTEREGIWVRGEAEEGTVGWGEVAPVPGFGGPGVVEDWGRLQALGIRPSQAAVDAVMEEGGAVAFALGSVTWDWETAVKDGPNYVPVAALLPAGRSAFAVVESKLELGFRTFKWKVGVADVRDELAMLDDLLALLPEGARLRLDANGVWDRRTAERWLNGAAERPGIEYVEQPTSPNNRDLLLGLAEDHPVTLALDEAVRGRSDFQLWRDLGWPGVYVLKPALWGAPDDLLTEVRGSEDDVVISSALETVVGARVVLAMGFALGTGQRALGVGVWPLFAGDGHEGPTAMPFIRQEEVLALSMERVETRCQGGRT